MQRKIISVSNVAPRFPIWFQFLQRLADPSGLGVRIMTVAAKKKSVFTFETFLGNVDKPVHVYQFPLTSASVILHYAVESEEKGKHQCFALTEGVK